MFERRQVLGGMALLGSAFAFGARAGARTLQDPNDPLQQAIAPMWTLVQSLPSIKVDASGPDRSGDVCYMFTNRSCIVCQGVDRVYPPGFRHLDMRYIIYPWPGEDRRLLNYLYRPQTTVAEYEQYMTGKLTARADSDDPALADQVLAATVRIAEELVEGGGFGTPFFFYAAPGTQPDSVVLSAGDIHAVQAQLDRGV
ncbi:MAG: permease [Rhizorhabdus sp.]|nr:permease [Rhizorhabdus sp.]